MSSTAFASVFGITPGNTERKTHGDTREQWQLLPADSDITPLAGEQLQQLLQTRVNSDDVLEAVNQPLLVLAQLREYVLRDCSANDKDAYGRVVAVMAKALPDSFMKDLSIVFYEAGLRCLGLRGTETSHTLINLMNGSEAWKLMLELAQKLHNMGLADVQGQEAFARACHDIVDDLVRENFGNHDTEVPCIGALETAMQKKFIPFVGLYLGQLGFQFGVAKQEDLTIATKHMNGTWRALAIAKLGELRSRQITDILSQRTGSAGGIADLRYCLQTRATRNYFLEQVHQNLDINLLHPARSTVDVLEMLMYIITRFREIDPSGVLLEHAVQPIKSFLGTRDDTVKIVIHSLLEPYSKNQTSTEMFCPEISSAMTNVPDPFYQDYFDGADIQEPRWIPEPLEAGPTHRHSTAMDELAHLLALQPKDIFIKELQNILGQRLVASESCNFEMELNLLNLLKTRFDEFKIQQCEIMLRDIVESQRIDQDICSQVEWTTAVHCKILSHHYWPRLRDETFDIQGSLGEAMEKYKTRYKTLKADRRLDWIPALGRVLIELQDGSGKRDPFVAEVSIAQAAVLELFDEDLHGPPNVQPACTFQQIQNKLEMNEDLLSSALGYWVGQRILRQDTNNPDLYLVVFGSENEDDTTQQEPAVQPEPAPAPELAIKTSADLLADNAKVYSSFIIGMLTNQGAMPAMRIRMMLRMMVPGGFPFEEDELAGFLHGLSDDGKIEKAGALWRVKRT